MAAEGAKSVRSQSLGSKEAKKAAPHSPTQQGREAARPPRKTGQEVQENFRLPRSGKWGLGNNERLLKNLFAGKRAKQTFVSSSYC